MPFQNRVNPRGELVAVSARGAWLGNRGILHNDDQQIIKVSQHNHWVICSLTYGDNHQTIFPSGHYSQLFFLDEATAFAAGHRPCHTCRNQSGKAFVAAWLAANPDVITEVDPKAKHIDKILHAERIKRGQKVTFDAPLGSLPSGTMIDYDQEIFLVWQGRLYKWSFTGYGAGQPYPAAETLVQVLTPQSIVKMFAQGQYIPQVHESAGQ